MFPRHVAPHTRGRPPRWKREIACGRWRSLRCKTWRSSCGREASAIFSLLALLFFLVLLTKFWPSFWRKSHDISWLIWLMAQAVQLLRRPYTSHQLMTRRRQYQELVTVQQSSQQSIWFVPCCLIGEFWWMVCFLLFFERLSLCVKENSYECSPWECFRLYAALGLEACQAYDKRMRADADNYVALQANPRSPCCYTSTMPPGARPSCAKWKPNSNRPGSLVCWMTVVWMWTVSWLCFLHVRTGNKLDPIWSSRIRSKRRHGEKRTGFCPTWMRKMKGFLPHVFSSGLGQFGTIRN